jgi:hypothetical protein
VSNAASSYNKELEERAASIKYRLLISLPAGADRIFTRRFCSDLMEEPVVPCKALYLQGTLLAEQLRRSGPVTRPPDRLL